MTLIKKTIVLSKNGTKGYVTVIRVGSSVGIKIVINSFEKGLIAGIKIGNNKLIIRNINEKKCEYNFDNYEFSNNDEISCLIIDRENRVFAEGGLRNRIRINDIIFSGSKDNNKTENIVNPIKKENATSQSSKNANNKINYDVYKQRQYKNFSTQPFNNPNGEDNFEIKKEIKNFYLSIKDKIDELFVIYPREEILEKTIPDSKWVRINYEANDFYTAGVLLDENKKVTHIAYGVPSLENIKPPKGTENICDFLPIKNMKNYNGYWLIFQDAENGEILPKE